MNFNDFHRFSHKELNEIENITLMTYLGISNFTLLRDMS